MPKAELEIIGDGEGAGAGHVLAEPDMVERLRLLVTTPQAEGSRDIRVVLTDPDTGVATSVATRFEGP
jgi:hypothetical protein